MKTMCRICAILASIFGSSAIGRAATIDLPACSITIDPATQTVTFRLVYDTPPSLQVYNSSVSAQDEFWIDILTHPSGVQQLQGFGGEDVRVLSSSYRVQDTISPPSFHNVATPLGYSAITTSRDSFSLLEQLIPYNETGSVVTVTTTFSQIHETDGQFEAIIMTDHFGALASPGRDFLPKDIAIVPLPAAVWGGLGLLGVLAITRCALRNPVSLLRNPVI